jgi:hypothetical protein
VTTGLTRMKENLNEAFLDFEAYMKNARSYSYEKLSGEYVSI